MTALDVYLHGRRAGSLERLEQGRLRFAYAEDWVEAGGAPLSLALPVRAEPFGDQESAAFFAGLLPEGHFLKAISRAYQVSEGNPFGLLTVIGGECAGAVSLGVPGEPPPGESSRPPRWLEDEPLHRLLVELPSRPLLSDDGEGIRISLAGAQDKLGVLFDDTRDRVGLTWGRPPTTHIVKAPIPGLPHSTANEAFCMSLAAQAGLDVAVAEPRRADGSDYLLVLRFDRHADDDGETRRRHQEDLCQALGWRPEQKYEAEGGPGVAACAELLWGNSAAPARDVPALLDALLFNFAIGNHDAHSKNYSLLLDGPGAIRLAPLYDLFSTGAYPGTAKKLAMKYGGENRPAYLRRRHLERLGEELRVKPAFARERAVLIAERVADSIDAARKAIPAPFADSPILGEVEAVIEERSARLLKAAGEATQD